VQASCMLCFSSVINTKHHSGYEMKDDEKDRIKVVGRNVGSIQKFSWKI
jgi:hypothetical protein